MTLGAIRWSLRSNDVAGMQTNLAWETLLDLPCQPGWAAAHAAGGRDPHGHPGRAHPAGGRPAAQPARSPPISASPACTVTQAYAQLVTEGYLTARTGSATRVSSDAPSRLRRGRRASRAAAGSLPLTGLPGSICPPPGRTWRAFPRRKWVEAIRAAAETAPFDQLDYAQSGGHPSKTAQPNQGGEVRRLECAGGEATFFFRHFALAVDFFLEAVLDLDFATVFFAFAFALDFDFDFDFLAMAMPPSQLSAAHPQ